MAKFVLEMPFFGRGLQCILDMQDGIPSHEIPCMVYFTTLRLADMYGKFNSNIHV